MIASKRALPFYIVSLLFLVAALLPSDGATGDGSGLVIPAAVFLILGIAMNKRGGGTGAAG